MATEVGLMLCDPVPSSLPEFDLQVYRVVGPKDHYLRKALQAVVWDNFHDLDLDAYVPPGKESETRLFKPRDFEEDVEQGQLICPAGQASKYRQRDNKKHTTVCRFDASVCRACPLMDSCLKETPQKAFGRTVRKTDYQVEYQTARDKATTEAYAAVRREHMKVERKLGEVMNCHGGRHARYRGRWKALIQELMACTVTDVKRLVRLVCAPNAEVSYQS